VTITAGTILFEIVAFGSDVIEPPNPIPLPAAVWLFGSGLLGLIGIAIKKRAA
jgi:hypothetical protein